MHLKHAAFNVVKFPFLVGTGRGPEKIVTRINLVLGPAPEGPIAMNDRREIHFFQ